MNRVSLKQSIVMVVIIAALLVALVGGLFRIEAARSMPPKAHAAPTMAWYCPAPPVSCFIF